MQPETRTQKLFRLWHGPLLNEEIAEELGVTTNKLYALARLHKLPKRKHPRFVDNENPRPGDPSPEEIQAGILAAQANWSEEERLQRFRGKRRVAYITPQYVYNGRTDGFEELN